MAKRRNRRKRKDDAGKSDLPSDIVEKILVRLPVKSLIRCKLLSKSWNSTVAEPRFKKMYDENLSVSRTHFLAWALYDGRRYCLLKFEDQKFQIEAFLGAPFGAERILCSCKGLVMVGGFESSDKLVMWNPCTRMYGTLPWRYNIDDACSHGLCYDSTHDDYKVVAVFPKCRYLVFSCKTGTWSKRRRFPKTRTTTENPGIYVDGACYWVCDDKRNGFANVGVNLKCIVYFDGREDSCGMLDLPEHIRYYNEDDDRLVLTCFRDSLCFYLYTNGATKIHMWKLEKDGSTNSWKELFTIDLNDLFLEHFRCLCPIKDNLIMIFGDFLRVLIYDTSEEWIVGEIPNSRERRIISNALKGFQIVPCEESLSFPIPNVS